MKQKILEALKAKFPGVNANVLNRIADKLAKTVTSDEQVTTAGKSSVSCPLKPSDSAPLKHSTMPP